VTICLQTAPDYQEHENDVEKLNVH